VVFPAFANTETSNTDVDAIGIGQATSIALSRSGANVAILDFDTDRLHETKAECEKYGATVFTYAVDITETEAVVDTFKRITTDLGPVEWVIANTELPIQC
jgi:NAD(P)-dependent dehydrogenase (short-subunit alcohol dehydrogenase family)